MANSFSWLLRAPNGRTTEDPCGLACLSGDSDAWHGQVAAVRDVVMIQVAALGGEGIPADIRETVTLWLWRTNPARMPDPPFWPGSAASAVAGYVALVSEGVALAAVLEEPAAAAGAVVPSPPAAPAVPGMFGSIGAGEIWGLAAVVAAVAALIYAAKKR